MTELKTEYIDLEDLVGNPRNPKAHNLEVIDDSMQRFGIVDPITLDGRTGQLISGHGRARVLAEMFARGDEPPAGVRVTADGTWLVPVNTGWSSKNDTEASAALIALNRTTELGGWVDESLLDLLEDISASDNGFTGIGYSDTDLDDLREMLERTAGDDGDLSLEWEREDKDLPDLDEAAEQAKGASAGGAMVTIKLLDTAAIIAWHELRDTLPSDDAAMRQLLGVDKPSSAASSAGETKKSSRRRSRVTDPTLDDLADDNEPFDEAAGGETIA